MFEITVVVAILSLVSGDPIRIFPSSIISINPFTPQGRIVGGQETSIEEYPWQVSLQVYGFHFCGGSIISKNVIVTAGHCTTNYPASFLSVRLGSSMTKSGGTVHKVTEIVRHEKYKTNIYGIPENDVAILKLETPIEMDQNKQPIPLFAKDEEAFDGVLSTITGWGALKEGGSAPEVLQSVDVPIVAKAECNEAYKSWGGIPHGQICAAYSAGGKDTCQGDSGGPLVINKRLAGIVSWGNGCARKGYPGVYTEVASIRDWINKNADI